MTFGLGVAAALAGPFVMSLGFIAWDNHWKGSAFALNLYKCNLASTGFLILSCTARSSKPFPSEVFTWQAIGYMVLSSTIGILIGDWTWLEALQMLGARRVILMDSLKPFLAAVMGWLILDEELRPAAFGGIVLTVTGVLIVSFETTTDEKADEKADEKDDSCSSEDKQDETENHLASNEIPEVLAADLPLPSGEKEDSTDALAVDENRTRRDKELVDTTTEHSKSKSPRALRRGYTYAILNVALDTYGAVLIKQHGKDFKVWEINLLRFGFAGCVMLLVSCGFTAMQVLHKTKHESSYKETPWYSLPMAEMTRSSWCHVSVGVLLVTFANPSLSNYALFEIALALALTLGSIGPLYSLPLAYLLQHDPPTIRSSLGALLAVAGVVLLTWKGTAVQDDQT